MLGLKLKTKKNSVNTKQEVSSMIKWTLSQKHNMNHYIGYETATNIRLVCLSDDINFNLSCREKLGTSHVNENKKTTPYK